MLLNEIIGQDRVKKHLVRTVRENRVSHAQLFLGQEGSGNLALAIAYAQYINCKNRGETDSCGTCPTCIKYDKLIHPDLHFLYPTATIDGKTKKVSKDFIDGWRDLVLSEKGYFGFSDWAKKIGIERKQAIINALDCSNLLELLSYKSYEADYKVMIIWMIEKLFYAAAPKILKILEEPPDKTLFILVSQSQEKIISTILSRTQLIKIPPIDEEDLIAALDKEGADKKKARDAARVSNGDYIEAKRLILSKDESDDHLTLFIKWMRLCFKIKFSEANDFSAELSKTNRDYQKGFLVYGLRMMREAFLLGFQQENLSRLNHKESSFLANFHPFVHQDNIELISEELNKAIMHIERNVNSNIMFMDLSIKLSQLIQKRST